VAPFLWPTVYVEILRLKRIYVTVLTFLDHVTDVIGYVSILSMVCLCGFM